jgi:hypothetical protein
MVTCRQGAVAFAIVRDVPGLGGSSRVKIGHFLLFSRAADLQLYLLRQFLSIGLKLVYLHSEAFLECK